MSAQNTKATEHLTAVQTVLAEEVGTNYTGYEYDEVLDMYYACDRMYDAQDKRFTTKDPVKGNVYDPVSINPYVYVSDNPLKYIDPLGQSPDILGTAWNGIKSGTNYVEDGVTSAATSVANGVKKTVKDVVSGVEKAWDQGVEFVQDIWDTTKGFFTRLGCLISNIDNCSKTLLGWSLGIGGMCVLAATPLGWAGAAATLVPGIVTGTLLGGATQAASTALSGGDKNEVWENFLGGAADGLLYSGAMSVVTAGSTAYYYGKVAGSVANTANKVSESFASAGTTIDAGGYPSDTFDYYMDLVEKLDVSTEPNTATFYLGQGNRKLAENFAKTNGKTTLEMTSGGKYLDDLKLFGQGSPLTQEEATNVWSRLSIRYAQNARGNTYGFVNGAWEGSIYNTVEYPALKANDNLTNIFTKLMP